MIPNRETGCKTMTGHGGLRAPDEGWSDDKVEALRILWLGGKLSMAEIGRALGVTKSAVSGKISRIGLLRRSAEEIGAAKRHGQLLAAEAKKAKSEAQRQRVEARIAERATLTTKVEARAPGPIGRPFVVFHKPGALARRPPHLALVSSVELPERPAEPPPDLYAHMRSEDGLRRAIAAMSRPPRNVKYQHGVSE